MAWNRGKGSYRDILKDKDGAQVLEQEQRQIKSVEVASQLISEYETRLAKEPNDRRLLRSIAELYVQKDDYDKALECPYGKIEKIEGQSDPSLDKAIVQAKVRKIEFQLGNLDPTDPEFEDKKAAIKKEKQELEISEAKRMAEAYPNDLVLRFDLGVLYFHAGRIGEAIQELQKAQQNPNKKVQALYYLGKSFAQRSMFDLAIRSLQNALAEKQAFDEEKKEILYALGAVFESRSYGRWQLSMYKHIYEVDIGFKDVGAKVDAYYSGGA